MKQTSLISRLEQGGWPGRAPSSPSAVAARHLHAPGWRLPLLLLLPLLCAAIILFCAQPARPAAAVQPLSAAITIDAARVEGEISPLLYGQFAEFMFENIKGGLHAELIRNRSFEEAPNVTGLSRYWERYPDDRNDDYALNFSWDAKISYPVRGSDAREITEHSQEVVAGDGVTPRHGLYQSRIPVQGGLEYRGYLWIKTLDYKGPLTVALEADRTGGEIYAAAELAITGGDWRRYEFTLRPLRSDPLARLSILFDGRGRLWLDQVSLLPGNAVGGVRADVLEKVKALRPAFVRWPGGNVAQDYHWWWGVGPRDERVTWVNLSWKNESEPSDFGTDEFIEFCRNIGAEPSITVNVEGRGATSEEAAAWVEYCNGAPTSRYGAMRAANGHPAPYNVRYWEIGNEIWGSWVRGHSDAETYGRNFNRYYEAMRAVDPTIKFIAVGDNDMSWNRTVLRLAGARMDYLAIHHYYGRNEMKNDALNLMARPLFYERFYKEVAQLIGDLAPGRPIRLAINEWGLDLPQPRQYSMESALYGARLMNVFERAGDLVGMSAVSDMVNGWPGGIIQASRHGVFVTPTFWANALYSNHSGTSRLATRVESPTFDTTLEGKAIPYLDAVSSRSSDGKLIYIKMVNTNQKAALKTNLNLTGTDVAPQAELETLTGATLASANGFATPDAVSVRRQTIKAGPVFVVELPKHSVSVLTLHVK
ncbi:MAG TPA: alpha-L-arabinofuranosidase C-terminal domain-containing protein [Pyrinomonadaceae bacterium]|jgi:alpha-N-arabinofuranosidase|nr:alpha-L-arabinofuranosidase C-terminal domain-containing protein [Pyrinomonadaceae bacterium]